MRHEREIRQSPLERIRRDRGLSQQQLADKVRTSQPQIDRLEKSQRKMTKEWAVRLAAALECHWLELLDESPPLSPREEKLVELYRGLSEGDQLTVFRIADAIASKNEPAPAPTPATARRKVKAG